MKKTSIQLYIVLVIACIANLFLSPKWFLGIALWIYYPAMIYFIRRVGWKLMIPAWIFLSLTGIMAQKGVVPLPFQFVVIMIFLGTLIGFIPFILDKYFTKASPGFISTLFFPTIVTLFTYFLDQGPQGTWSNPIYTQYHFTPFIQFASVAGLYGMNFMVCWFGSILNFIWERKEKKKSKLLATGVYTGIFILILVFGMVHLKENDKGGKTLMLASISMDNLDVMKSMYTASFDTSITISGHLNQSSKELAELNRGMDAFLRDSKKEKYKPVYQTMDRIFDSYLNASKEAVNKGARVIAWPEGCIVNTLDRDSLYIHKASKFSSDNEVYLFLPTAVMHTEKYGNEDKFMENKVVVFNDRGEIVNSFLKNIPISGVEPSFPGDGTIPIIETPMGKLSPSICYDLDFPTHIRQTGSHGTELLVVPTGDWKEIAPYHTYQAAFRCIENGINMLKPVSNGLSAVIDPNGRILASDSFFDGEEVYEIVYNLDIKTKQTMYSKIGDSFILILQIGFLLLLGWWIYIKFSRR